MQKSLEVILNLKDNDHFDVIITDNESGMSRTFNENTHNIDVAIGVEIMSWLDLMSLEDDE